MVNRDRIPLQVTMEFVKRVAASVQPFERTLNYHSHGKPSQVVERPSKVPMPRSRFSDGSGVGSGENCIFMGSEYDIVLFVANITFTMNAVSMVFSATACLVNVLTVANRHTFDRQMLRT